MAESNEYPGTDLAKIAGLVPSAITLDAVESAESSILGAPSLSDVLTAQSSRAVPDAGAVLRISNSPIASNPEMLLGEPTAERSTEPGISQSTTTINNFNTLLGADEDKIKTPQSVLTEQLRKLEEMQKTSIEEKKTFESTKKIREIAAKPSTAMAELNKRIDRDEAAPAGSGSEAAAPKTRFAGIKAALLKGASALGSMVSSIVSPESKAGTGEKEGGSLEDRMLANIRTALGKGMSPNEVTAEEAEPTEKPKGSARTGGAGLPAGIGKGLKPTGEEAPSEKMSEVGNEEEESEPTSMIGNTPGLLNLEGEGPPDVFKKGNYEARIGLESLKGQESEKAGGSSSYSSTKKDETKISVKNANPISSQSSTINKILNPPNPVEKGIKALNNTISSTSKEMSSSIKEMAKTTVKDQGSSLGAGVQNITNSSSTVNNGMEGSPGEAEKKPEDQKVESQGGDELSSYYLQAIYDALVVQGIKIRTI